MFAVMKDTEYATKKTFIDNFMKDWRAILGPNHVIKQFELCDFTPIYEWHLKEKEKKKQMTSAVSILLHNKTDEFILIHWQNNHLYLGIVENIAGKHRNSVCLLIIFYWHKTMTITFDSTFSCQYLEFWVQLFCFLPL